MAAKQKASKGKVLKKRESQRPNQTYQYRYIDCAGKRHTIYAPTLDEPRKKEAEIDSQTNAGLDYAGDGITVL